MQEYYFEVPLSNSKSLCVGSITRTEADAARDEASFYDGFGYYLFIADSEDPHRDIEIIGKLASPDAALRLGDLLSLGQMRAA